MDFSKLSKSDKIIGVGAIVGIVSAFLPWYSWSVSVFGVSSGGSINGLNSWWMLSFIAAILSLLMIALPLFGVALPKLGIQENVLQMILGAVVGGIPVLALLSGASQGAAITGLGSAGASFGLFGAIAGGVIILLGAFMAKGGVKPTGTQTPPPAEPQA